MFVSSHHEATTVIRAVVIRCWLWVDKPWTDRPNIVWILSEDNSTHFLKMFDGSGAPTPNIERLAAHGLVFDHAFSCAPVCSVEHTTLMTAIYVPRNGQLRERVNAVKSSNP